MKLTNGSHEVNAPYHLNKIWPSGKKRLMVIKNIGLDESVVRSPLSVLFLCRPCPLSVSSSVSVLRVIVRVHKLYL